MSSIFKTKRKRNLFGLKSINHISADDSKMKLLEKAV